MEIKYEEVYSSFVRKITDKSLLKKDRNAMYTEMKMYLEETFAIPAIAKLFSDFSYNETVEIIKCELKDSSFYDKNFVQDILAQGMVIAWMQAKLDTDLNFVKFFGGKEEKKMMDNYNLNLQRLERLEIKLEKQIRNHGYYNGTYGE